MVLFAHASHWLASVMYVMPVIILMGFLGVVKVKERRERSRVGLGEQPEGQRRE